MPRSTILAAALLAPLLFVPAADAANAPPTPAMSWSADPTVGRNVTFSASATDEDPDGVTFAWDFDHNATTGFVADAIGASAVFAFATPGTHRVMLRATDADGAVGNATRTVAVDDFFVVDLTFVYAPNREDPIFAHVRVSDWTGAGVPNQPVRITKVLQPQPEGDALTLHEATVTTAGNGEKYFPIPRDSMFGNVPGRHVVTATTTLPTSILGDRETATDRIAYALGLPI